MLSLKEPDNNLNSNNYIIILLKKNAQNWPLCVSANKLFLTINKLNSIMSIIYPMRLLEVYATMYSVKKYLYALFNT